MISVGVLTLAAALSTATAEIFPPQHGHRVVCYVWALDNDQLRFTSSDAEPAFQLCTHIIYLRGELQGTSLEVELHQDHRNYGLSNVNNLVSMKFDKFPFAKIIIGVGFLASNRSSYAWMAETPSNRETFIQNLLEFVLEHDLDGVDVGWSFPATEPGFTENSINQVIFLKELRQEFDKHGLSVSVSVIRTTEANNAGVDVTGLADNAHFINIGSHVQNWFNKSLKRFIIYGIPIHKLNIVVFSMVTIYDLKKPVKDLTFHVNNVTPSGLMHYSSLCKEIADGVNLTERFDPNAGVVYYFKDDFLATSDNRWSTYLKLSYALNLTLGGIAFMSLDFDDYKGECVTSGGNYPILRGIDRGLIELSSQAYRDVFHDLEIHDACYFWNGTFLPAL